MVCPEQYTQPPPTQSHRTDLMIDCQPPAMSYRRAEVLTLPYKRRYEKIEIMPDVSPAPQGTGTGWGCCSHSQIPARQPPESRGSTEMLWLEKVLKVIELSCQTVLSLWLVSSATSGLRAPPAPFPCRSCSQYPT